MTRLIVLLALLGVTACETIEGAGQDLENTGEAISEEAREVQAGMWPGPQARRAAMNAGLRALTALLALMLVASCGPLIGAGAVVAVDEAKEREDGGDGLF
jgi:entericidin B